MFDATHLKAGPPRAPVAGLRRSLVASLFLLAMVQAGQVPGATDPDSTESGPVDTSLTASVQKSPKDKREVLPAMPRAVRAGESLRFSVNYGFINAGAAYLEVLPDVKEWNGFPVYRLVARAESNRFFSGMYKVRNRIESFWDSTGHFSRRYLENRREGKHRAQNEIVFDYTKQEARYQDGKTFPIPPGVQDALSSFYYTRTQPLPLGGSLYFDYHASRKSVPMEVKVLGREKVETPAGTFKCVVIEPVLKAGGIFKNKGRLVIWLTDDERRMPVLMKSKVLIGSISATLVEIKPGA
jgi:hypothetical protein